MKRTDFRIHPTVYVFLGCFLTLPAGCTKPPTDIGLGLQPASELIDVAVTDTVTVELATVREQLHEDGPACLHGRVELDDDDAGAEGAPLRRTAQTSKKKRSDVDD